MIWIDMEMPEKCGLCPLFHAEHPMYCQGVKADRKKKIVAPYRDPRPEWCPLHEVTDTDTVSRQDVITLVENIENRRLMGEIDLTYAPMLKGVKALSPSPSRPHDISKAKFSCPICGAEMEVTVDEWDEGGAV